MAARALLLTGRPGAGKTTVIRRVATALSESRLAGFYTEEIREAGVRRGFRLVTLDGREAVMAHVRLPGPARVGRYGVDVQVLDDLAATVLETARTADVCLLDEIGKMECLSGRFVDAVRALLGAGTLCVAAVALRGPGLIAEVKERADVELWEVTPTNRDTVPGRVVAWVRARRATPGPPGS